jgi:hypothetical protein
MALWHRSQILICFDSLCSRYSDQNGPNRAGDIMHALLVLIKRKIIDYKPKSITRFRNNCELVLRKSERINLLCMKFE